MLADMHIPDWDDRFLSQLDAADYVETMARSGAGVIMVYCNSHVGLALYPSEIGPIHRAIAGRDFVGEALTRARGKGLGVIAYYSAVFDNAAFLQHPEWRILPAQGESIYQTSRYGACCPNSPYSEFAIAQSEEICRRYAFDGIFFDMLFWPFPCYCQYCKERFDKETSKSLPLTVDWTDSRWIAFVRARERWMSEFAGKLTNAVNRTRPEMTVTHQTSPVLLDWRAAMPYSLAEHCEYASGDFYGSPIQQSVVCKIFASISPNKPFEFMTSRCTNLRDHVTTKPDSQLEMQAFLAPAHAAAFMFIDAIDPLGTLHPAVYERIGAIFSKMAPYEKFLGGTLTSDVAIYVSPESRFDERETGMSVADSGQRSDNMATEFAGQHMTAVMGAAQSLQEAHIPYAVVTQHDLGTLTRYRVIILPNILLMSEKEVAAFRDFVRAGGALYASGNTSLYADTGQMRENFGLADVFGVSARSRMNYSLCFFSPADAGISAKIAPQGQFIHRSGWLNISSQSAAVLADLYEPWAPESGGSIFRPSFASIHSTPPAAAPAAPGITRNSFGRGETLYAAGSIEAEKQSVSRRAFVGLIRQLLGGPSSIEAEGPSFVEITVFDKPDRQLLNISLVSLRQTEDPIPCAGTVRVRLKDKSVAAVRRLPGLEIVPTRPTSGGIEFDFDNFTTFSMYQLEYQLS